MTKLHQIYKCDVCGNIVDVVHASSGELVCCGQAMTLQEVKDVEEAGTEKHLPVIEKLPEDVCKGGDGVEVKIGEVEHPMEEDHYIEWISIKTDDGKIGRKFLNHGDKPVVTFQTRSKIKEVFAYCNIHGLWKINIK